jgi:hypothetical protein
MERLAIFGDGEVRRDVNVTWTEEQYKEFVQGYRCIRCFGPTSEAFPEHCPTPFCDGYPEGFPMKERQREVMDKEFDGEEWIGISRETYEAEQNELEPKTTKGQSRIWVPGKD